MNYEIDVNYGDRCEKIVIDKLQLFFNNSLTKLDYYDTFDFIDDKKDIYIELKSRRCKIDTYDTTMVGMNKINISKILTRKKKKIIYFFQSVNGLVNKSFITSNLIINIYTNIYEL